MDEVKALVVLASIDYPGDGIAAKNNYQTSSGQLRSKRAQVCGAQVAGGHNATSGTRPKQHRRDNQRSRTLSERPGIGLHTSGRQGLAPGRFRLGARRTLSTVAEGAASGGAGTALLKMTVLR